MRKTEMLFKRKTLERGNAKIGQINDSKNSKLSKKRQINRCPKYRDFGEWSEPAKKVPK